MRSRVLMSVLPTIQTLLTTIAFPGTDAAFALLVRICDSELPRTLTGNGLAPEPVLTLTYIFLTLMSSTVVRSPDFSLRAALRLALLFAAIKLVLQFALTLWTQHIGYSYFRD